MSANRAQRARGTLRYDKPALDHDDLIDRMVDRGLVVPDRERAARYLRHIGYYRLSPYLIPFRAAPSSAMLREGMSFDQVLDLYVFDRKLRLLVMDAVERIEVGVRAALTDTMSLQHGGPFWYTDDRHFRDRGRHASLLGLVKKDCDAQLRRDEESPPGDLARRVDARHGNPERLA